MVWQEGMGAPLFIRLHGSYGFAICPSSTHFLQNIYLQNFSYAYLTIQISSFQSIPYFTMKYGNYGSCILSNLLEASHKYALLFSTNANQFGCSIRVPKSGCALYGYLTRSYPQRVHIQIFIQHMPANEFLLPQHVNFSKMSLVPKLRREQTTRKLCCKTGIQIMLQQKQQMRKGMAIAMLHHNYRLFMPYFLNQEATSLHFNQPAV